MTTTIEKNRIVIDDAKIADTRNLYQALHELYLGEKQSYQIYVHEKHLSQLNKIMDEIIMKCGLRNVSFDYSLMRTLCGEEDVKRALL